jgi:hypothetical protein
MHRLSSFIYMDAIFEPSDIRIKKMTDIKQDEVFIRTSGYALIEHKRNEEIFEELKAEPYDEKLRRYKSNWL